MEIKQAIVFSTDFSSFEETVQFKYCRHRKCLYAIFPIIGITHNENFKNITRIFETSYSIVIENISQIAVFEKSWCQRVESFFEKNKLNSDFIKDLELKLTNWLDVYNKPQPIIVEKTKEYLPVDSKTNFYGNYEINGVECCRAYYSFYKHLEKPFTIILSGNDNDSWSKYFSSEKEMAEEVYRLRRCSPINKIIDVENNGYVFTN